MTEILDSVIKSLVVEKYDKENGMIGTIANSAMILAGGVVGLFLKKGIKQSIEHSVHMATGLAVFVIGLNLSLIHI